MPRAEKKIDNNNRRINIHDISSKRLTTNLASLTFFLESNPTNRFFSFLSIPDWHGLNVTRLKTQSKAVIVNFLYFTLKIPRIPNTISATRQIIFIMEAINRFYNFLFFQKTYIRFMFWIITPWIRKTQYY